MTDPTPPGGYQPAPPPPEYGQPPLGAYKGSSLGLPHAGPNSLASPWARLGAKILDFLILLVPMISMFVTLAGDALREIEPGDQVDLLRGDFVAPSLLFLLLTAVYEVFFLTRSGATPGKSAVGIRVANVADGGNPSVQSAAIRWAVGYIPGYLPVGAVFSLVNSAWCLWDDNRQCLHDKAVKTVVVNT